MKEVSEQVLIEALDLLEQGLSIEEIVSRYQSDADDLRQFLVTATALSTMATQPSLAAQQKSKATFLTAAEEKTSQSYARTWGWIPRVLAPIFAVLAIFFLSGFVLVNSANPAVPGDALYETKRSYENFRLAWTSDPERAALLRDQYRQRRLEEVEALLGAGREEVVSFTGTIEVMNPDGHWIVDGVPVRISPVTAVDGGPAAGSLIQIDGRTANGAVEAESVLVLNRRLDLPALQNPPTPELVATSPPTTTPTPADTVTMMPSPTLTATVTPQPEEMPTQIPEVTIEPSPAPVQPATSQPEPQPTSASISPTATPDNDGNDDDDDGGDDNDGGDAIDNDNENDG